MSENERPGKETRIKKKKKRRLIRRLTVLAVLLILLGGFGFLVVRKLQRDHTVTYDAYTTTIGTISNSLSYSGSMQLISSKAYTADSAAKVREIYVSAGDSVREGDRLIRLSNGTVISAEFDGKINKISFEKGDEVQKGDELIQVADFSNMQVSFRVGESDISQVSVGQDVRVTVASANASFRSKVKSIDYVTYSGNNVAYYTAVAEVDTSSAKDIYPGMQATVTIPKEEVRDVVILKMDAVSTANDNSAFVYKMAEDGSMTEHPITVGVSNGNYVEIREGLNEGETVYVVAAKEEEAGLFDGLFRRQQVNQPGNTRNRNMENMNWNQNNRPGNSVPNR